MFSFISITKIANYLDIPFTLQESTMLKTQSTFVHLLCVFLSNTFFAMYMLSYGIILSYKNDNLIVIQYTHRRTKSTKANIRGQPNHPHLCDP